MIIIVVLSLLVIVAVALLQPWISLFLGTLMSPNPEKPEVLYGEFPFTLTYELDGQIQVINDTIVCEFDGFINRGTAGKARKWNTTLKSGKEQLTLLDLRSSNEENELKQTVLELYFSYGTGAYYMGDVENPFAREAQSFDWVDYKYQTKDGKIGGSGYKADEAFKKYNIRLISWECAPPIENNFR